jgi:hypothetical protein
MATAAATLDRLVSIAADAFAKKMTASGYDGEQALKDHPEIRQRLSDKVVEVNQQLQEIAQASRGQGLKQLAATLPALMGVTPPNLNTSNPLTIMEAVMEAVLVKAGNAAADDFVKDAGAASES